MNYEGFLNWLKTEKGLTNRSAGDNVSRLKRVLRINNETKINHFTIERLSRTSDFNGLSRSVKAQLKRAVLLYQEFEK